MSAETGKVGQPASRIEGRAKVTGEARYAAEVSAPGLLYGVVVSSTVARGRITLLDASAALAVPGVVQVFSHQNRPNLAWFDRSYRDDDAPKGSPFRPLRDDEIHYSGQPVALVVAETFEAARYAASVVRVDYQGREHETDLSAQREQAYAPGRVKLGYEPPPRPRGDPEKALREAAHRVDAEYTAPAEFHHPMEMHASTVIIERDGTLTIHDKTQGVANTQSYVTRVFGLSKDKVRVKAQYVGGAFGSGLRPQYQLFLAVLAARELKRSVRVVLTRQQMFTFGHRPETIQRVRLGASAEGKLLAIEHEAIAETSRFEEYAENVVTWSGKLYACDHVRLGHKLARLDVFTPLDMRAPGAAWGVHALECAMDELAHAAGIDPLALRLLNYAERDPSNDKPWSSKELRACYQQGAERFGWSRRTSPPRSMRDGRTLIGWGMATGTWDALQINASARATLTVDGKLVVSSAITDIGTGTYTILAQVAADTLGLPLDAVRIELGDTDLPAAPLQGGSWSATSVGTAVQAVCAQIARQLLALAKRAPGSPVADAGADEVAFEGGKIQLKSDPARAISITEAMRSDGALAIEEEASTLPNLPRQMAYSRGTHSAVFVEVRVDEALGTVRVARVVSAIAGGRVLNPKTARSQIVGGVVWGISMALEEEGMTDHVLGRVMNHSLAEYHVAVNADVPAIDVIFVDERDEVVSPLGAKGLGEIGIVGVGAAIANAVFHATGKRVRALPIMLDKVL